jgi:hypothetical protein
MLNENYRFNLEGVDLRRYTRNLRKYFDVSAKQSLSVERQMEARRPKNIVIHRFQLSSSIAFFLL